MDSQADSGQNHGSILDRVLSSQHAAAIEGFVPTAVFSQLVKPLTEKEQDVLRRRFGLHGHQPETLEEIGVKYTVTRERIRQIENTAVGKIRDSKGYREIMQPIERLLTNVLTNHGGIMEEQAFYSEMLSTSGGTSDEQRALHFLFTQLLSHRIEHRPADEVFRESWKLVAQSLELVTSAVQELEKIIERYGRPIERDQLLGAFRELPIATGHAAWFTDQVVLSYLGVAAQIGKNPFGEYGLVSWGTIAPRRMNDKIYLVLKKHGKPLHFTEIADRINEAGFDRRKAYPPTVHNELILNSEYVLVGRGIYALKEWGYKPGVVVDVLVDILTKAGKPMSRDEIVRAVLEQRMVKRNTILLALTNKQRFTRLSSGEYTLAGNQHPVQS